MQKQTFIYFFLSVVGSFYLSQSVFSFDLYIISLFLGKLMMIHLPCEGRYSDQDRQSLPFWSESRVFSKVGFDRQFSTPNEIARRVPYVWVLNFQMYYNCCSFFLHILN